MEIRRKMNHFTIELVDGEIVEYKSTGEEKILVSTLYFPAYDNAENLFTYITEKGKITASNGKTYPLEKIKSVKKI
jgi:ribosomal protein S18